jgi:hypothetical protein
MKQTWFRRLAIAAAIAVPALAPLSASAGPTMDAIKSKGCSAAA